jgi:hypothetical protein|nr:MAG TPA: hypothetical protein [Caudoviricetes sp.]
MVAAAVKTTKTVKEEEAATKTRRKTKKQTVEPLTLLMKRGKAKVDSMKNLTFSLYGTTTVDGWGVLDFGTVDIPPGKALYLEADLAGTNRGVLIIPKLFNAGKDVQLIVPVVNLSREFRTLYGGESLVKGTLVTVAEIAVSI